MEFASVLALRDEVLEDYYLNGLQMSRDEGIRAHSAPVPEIPGQRIAIGARFVSGGIWKVAIRVQSQGGRAMNYARRFIDKKQLGSEVDLAVVKASVPSQTNLIAQGGSGDPGAKRCRPPQIGYSIGHLDGGPGTLGLFAMQGNAPVALSCNHVLARANRAEKGDDIFQAGPPDSPPSAGDLLGKLGDFRYLKRVGSNEIDAAFCEIDSDAHPESNALPDWAGADRGKALTPPVDLDALADLLSEEGARVAKAGKKTLLTSAPAQNVIVGVNDVTVMVPGLGNCRFDNVIEIEADSGQPCFSDVGDSGSTAFVAGAAAPFGMIFAGGTTERTGGLERHVSYACDLGKIFAAYGLDPML